MTMEVFVQLNYQDSQAKVLEFLKAKHEQGQLLGVLDVRFAVV